MKKITIMAALLLLVPMTSFAEYTGGTDGKITLGSVDTTSYTIGVSNGVQVDYTGATNGQGYVIGAYHEGGGRTYGSSSGATNVYFQDGTGVAVPTEIPTGSESADFTGWTAL